MHRVLIAFAAAMAALPGTSYAQELWNGLAAGDSISEAMKTFPNAAESGRYSSGPDEVVYDVPDLPIAGWPGSASLWFKSCKLESVYVHIDVDGIDSIALDKALNDVKAILAEKYGDPSTCDEKGFLESTTTTCDWTTKAVKVEMKLYNIAGMYEFDVAYQPQSTTVDGDR